MYIVFFKTRFLETLRCCPVTLQISVYHELNFSLSFREVFKI